MYMYIHCTWMERFFTSSYIRCTRMSDAFLINKKKLLKLKRFIGYNYEIWRKKSIMHLTPESRAFIHQTNYKKHTCSLNDKWTRDIYSYQVLYLALCQFARRVSKKNGCFKVYPYLASRPCALSQSFLWGGVHRGPSPHMHTFSLKYILFLNFNLLIVKV